VRATRRAAATFAEAVDESLVEIPDLQPFPGPLDKAHVLLEAAAEVEHMLLIQYLYAALTLKSGAPLDVLKPDERTAVRSWRGTLMGISIEEMGHLMSVQNLRLLLGADAIFDREEFPPREDIYPFVLHLEPLSRTSLAKYVLAEAPFASDAELESYREIVGMSTKVRHVGVIYGLLAVLFSSPDTIPPADSTDEWEQFVRKVAIRAGAMEHPDAWHIPEGSLLPESFAKQGDPAHFSAANDGFFFERVRTLADARALTRRIGVQGEAPVESAELVSHYRRFRRMFEGNGTILKFPADGAFVPSADVDTDPSLASYDGAALEIAKRLDATYAALLASLAGYFSAGAKADRERLAWEALEQMTDIKSDANRLVTLPQNGATTRRASPVFSMPK
jgi:hypothetical protein